MALTAQQEYVARWLRRAGRVSRHRAERMGIAPEALDALVAAGVATRSDDRDPIYSHAPSASPAGPTSALREEAKRLPPSVDRRLLDLLADGVPRSAPEIAAALAEGRDFVARREVWRDVQRALPGLGAGGTLRRLLIGSADGARYDEKYVIASAVVPVCQPCFRDHWDRDALASLTTGKPIELCAFPDCRRRVNDAAYVPRAEFEEREGRSNGQDHTETRRA